MRGKKKNLKLKKSIIANLRTYTIKGGTGSNPCVPTGPNPSHTCQTYDGYTCPLPCYPDTRTQEMTQPDNPCTCAGREGIPNEGNPGSVLSN